MVLALKQAAKFAPREYRMAIKSYSVLLLPDGREISILMTNTSNAGFGGVSASPLAAGTALGVSIADECIVRAEVRWADGLEFGACFERALSTNQLNALVR